MTDAARIASLEARLARLEKLVRPQGSLETLTLAEIGERWGVKKTSVSEAIRKHNAEHVGRAIRPISRGRYTLREVERLERWRRERRGAGEGEQAWK